MDRQNASKSAFFAAILILLATVVPAAWFRFIAQDEGFYLYAAKLVAQGQMPYRDFFYPQMPFLPYVYALWLKLFGVGWHQGRMLSALATVCLGLMLYRRVSRTTGKDALGLSAVALFSLCSFTLGWLVLAKTYALATALCFAAYLLFSRRSAGERRYFFSGLLLGLSVGVRLLFAVLLPVFLFGIFRLRREKQASLSSYGWFIGGFAVAMTAILPFVLLPGYDRFIFNNITYHHIITSSGLAADLPQKISVIMRLLGLPVAGTFIPDQPMMSLQFKLLLLFNVLYVVLCRMQKRKLELSFYIMVMLWIASLLPNPSYVQYFTTSIPFMIVNAVLAGGLVLKLPSPKLRGWLLALSVSVMALFCLLGPYEAYRFTHSGKGVMGIDEPGSAEIWKIETVKKTSNIIDRHARGAGYAYTFWPGYFVESKVPILPGMENNFGLFVGDKMHWQQRRRYRVIAYSEIKAAFENGYVDIAIIGEKWLLPQVYKLSYDLIQQNDFTLAAQTEFSDIYCSKKP